MTAYRAVPLAAAAFVLTGVACGGGVPVRVQVDEFTMELALDDVVDTAFAKMQAQGLFPPESQGLPVIWPDSLPDVQFGAVLATDGVPVDLTPEPGSPDEDKYAEINKVEDAIRRIEMNRMILRVEQNSLTVDLPPLDLQVADDPDARDDDRLAWRTVGRIPVAPAGVAGDYELELIPSGESYLNAQLGDEAKAFAMRVKGRIDLDTTANGGRLPSGRAVIRMIVVATFFVEPEGAL
jgi:hypothetical protein